LPTTFKYGSPTGEFCLYVMVPGIEISDPADSCIDKNGVAIRLPVFTVWGAPKRNIGPKKPGVIPGSDYLIGNLARFQALNTPFWLNNRPTYRPISTSRHASTAN
jgi:hypothetical protein